MTKLITFNKRPSTVDLIQAANNVAEVVTQVVGDTDASVFAMIGGAPYFMVWLESALDKIGVQSVYAFSERVAVEDPTTGVKTSVFKHAGWVGLDD